MILQRLAKHVKDQNWFAIAIEFVIVVAGVLFAFQISESASRQTERDYAHDTLVRLERELYEIQRVRARTRTFIERNIEGIAAARPIIMGYTEADALAPEQCFALSRSHVIDRPADDAPTLEEVIQSGILASIRNDELRLAMMRFASKQDAVREWVRLKATELDNLAELYPELMWYELVEDAADDDGWDQRIACDLNAMNDSRAFQTHMMGNYTVMRDTREFVYDFMDEAIGELHTAIDAELGITHEPEVQP